VEPVLGRTCGADIPVREGVRKAAVTIGSFFLRVPNGIHPRKRSGALSREEEVFERLKPVAGAAAK